MTIWVLVAMIFADGNLNYKWGKFATEQECRQMMAQVLLEPQHPGVACIEVPFVGKSI